MLLYSKCNTSSNTSSNLLSDVHRLCFLVVSGVRMLASEDGCVLGVLGSRESGVLCTTRSTCTTWEHTHTHFTKRLWDYRTSVNLGQTFQLAVAFLFVLTCNCKYVHIICTSTLNSIEQCQHLEQVQVPVLV